MKISRADQRHIYIHSDGDAHSAHLGIVDSRISSDHASLIRDAGYWKIVDEGSKNGTSVNGRRQRTAILRDADLIELGRTFFVFREAVPMPYDAPEWFDAPRMDGSPGLATMTPVLAERFGQLARLAATRASIVIQGPSGSGKELLAGAVHTMSGRSGPFIAVNCAGLSEAHIESELFGNVQGAFSGATSDRDGLIAASAGGTLFLDEIDDLPPSAQGKLLRVLQERVVRPVGGTAEIGVDLRIVSATRRDLDRMVQRGKFRDDLLDRLGTRFELPSLRERREDLGLIIDAILERLPDPNARHAELSVTVMRQLLNHSWPRNVRELQKVLERAVALAGTAPIDSSHLPTELRPTPSARLRSPRSSDRLDGSQNQLPLGDLPGDSQSSSTPRLRRRSANRGIAYDAFVSYRRDDPEDRAWVEDVMVPRLEQLGVRLCLEHRDFPLGSLRIRELEKAVEASRYLIAVLTPSYVAGDFEDFQSLLCQHQSLETGTARFVPILRRPCRPPLSARMTALLDLSRDLDVDAGLQRLALELRKPLPADSREHRGHAGDQQNHYNETWR